MTEKLYYQDPYMRSFASAIQKQETDEKGRHYAVLEATAFYPTGGGQPHDIGTLNGVAVYDIEEIEGEIRHYIEEPLRIDETAEGEVNWNRRFDHMQQHTAQHMLSAAFEDVYGYKTVSFHLGKDICSIDLDTNNLTKEETNDVEQIVNQVIQENRLIETKWVTEDELSAYPLRKKLSVKENIRLVIIDDFDYNGCGGTHPDSAGQVGALKILHWEKQKKKVRVYFVGGARVLKQLGEKHDIIQNLTDSLNVPQKQLPEAGNRLVQRTKDFEKTIEELKTELLEHEANLLIKQAQEKANYNLIDGIFNNRPMPELQQLAKLITTNSTDSIVIFINQTERKVQIVCARGEKLDLHINQLLKRVLAKIDGKGGGTEALAQGGGEKTATAEQLLRVFFSHLEETSSCPG